MLEQTASVVDVRADRLVVEVAPESSCGSCAVKNGCGTSVLSKTLGRKVIQFELDNTVDASVGDRVVLGVPEDAMLSGSLLMYLMPLLCMFLLALVADATIAAEAASRDLQIAGWALTGLAISVLVSRKMMRPAGAYEPRLLRKHIDLQPASH